MKFAPIFQDHAVLQRNAPIPIWGTAGADEDIIVTLGNAKAFTTAGADGRWLLRLPPQPAGGPFELAAESASGRAVLSDILVGEVWICAGQSNMEWTLKDTEPLDEEALAPMPNVRVITVTNPARLNRTEAIKGTWAAGTTEALKAFSGVGAWFARRIHAELGVPMGLIGVAWGGTRVQAWMSRDALAQDPLYAEDLRIYEQYIHAPERALEVKIPDFGEWERLQRLRDKGNRGLEEGWAQPDFQDSSWSTMPVPSRWQEQGHPESGIFWFRRTLEIPPDWKGRDLMLHLGAVDKHDDTWVNGTHIGGISWEDNNSWCTPRRYRVPGHLTKAGHKVSIAVRARSHVYHGGLNGPEAVMQLALADNADDDAAPIPLAGTWRYAVEQDWGLTPAPGSMFGMGGDNNPNSLAILFNSRIAPLLPYAIRGAIWYQGESNAAEAGEYRRLMPAMIRDWRRAWAQGDFPFFQVQLANYKPWTEKPGPSEWAELREAQLLALSEPNTGIAVAIDVGDPLDIHPRDKRSVGLRLARWALAETYGLGGIPSGPLYLGKSYEANGRIRIRFLHGIGLRTRNGKPPGEIAIAAHDKKFRWAESIIDGETLVVWHPDILKPEAVRYAWADNPEHANLVNAEDLPASPFRTDSW